MISNGALFSSNLNFYMSERIFLAIDYHIIIMQNFSRWIQFSGKAPCIFSSISGSNMDIGNPN